MAALTLYKVGSNAVGDAGVLTALAADTYVDLPWTYEDEDMMVVVSTQATTDPTVTIKAGDGIRSKIGDLSLSLTKGKVYALRLESSRFKNKASGIVQIKSSQADSVAVFGVPTLP
jgi:hypothetical protein